MSRVLVIDNYDSFTMNLVQPLLAQGLEVEVVRNDARRLDELLDPLPRSVVLSPGPNRPEQAGVCVELVREAGRRGIPLLGVCLGHQALAMAFGGAVIEAEEPLHGRPSTIEHDGAGVFRGLPSPLEAGRYHSLIVGPELPAEFERSAWSERGEVMGIRHRELPLEGVQFHPESYLTPLGERMLLNFVASA